MSRANRRSVAVAVPPVPQRATPRSGAPGASDAGGSVSKRHVLVGFLLGEAVLFLLSNIALGVTNAVFGSDGLQRADGGIVGMSTFIAVIVGGFAAARLTGRFGVYHGVWVGVGFIVVGAVFQLGQEAQLVHSALGTGSHQLVDLGPMSMGNLISGDLLALFGGSFGGWLGEARPMRREAAAGR